MKSMEPENLSRGFRRLFSLFALVAAVALAQRQAVQAGDWETIRPANSEVETLAEGFQFTEGPAWHPDGFLLFTDIPNDRIHKFDKGQLSVFQEPVGRCNGLMCDQQGMIYACQMGDGHVLKMNAEGEILGRLVDTFDGKRMNGPNDLAIDSHGGMYFTDPYYGPDKPLPQPTMAVYYVSPDGETKRIIEDLERPNGVTVSPNGKYLYVAEPNKAELYRYSILGPGRVTAGHLIFKGDPEKDGTSGPDGMTHDKHGNIYTTYSGIVVLDPEGDVLGRISTPQKPSNCTFGGEDNKSLYITARTGLYKIDLGVEGIDLPEKGPELPKTTWKLSLPSLTMTVLLADEDKKTRNVDLDGLTLTVPESWDSQEPDNRLRLAQFSIPAAEGTEAETELVVFPPFGGTIDQNITRWVRQFDEQGRKMELTQGKTKQGKYYMANLAGTYKKPDGPPFLRKTIDAPDHRMLAVILQVEGKGNYFLKLVGPQKTVDDIVDDFRNTFGANADEEKEYELKN